MLGEWLGRWARAKNKPLTAIVATAHSPSGFSDKGTDGSAFGKGARGLAEDGCRAGDIIALTRLVQKAESVRKEVNLIP